MIESVNKCAVELFEFSAEELVDKSFTSIFCDEAQAKERAQSFTNSLLKNSSDGPVKIMMRKKSGVEFPVEISLFLISNDSKKQYLANILDVTHRHEMERVKREFTAMITHDLKTPLTSIHLFLDMLSGDMYELPGSLSATAKNLSMSVTRAIDMINSILDIEKLEAGRLELSLDKVSISDLLSNAIACVKPLADHRQVSILQNENVTANVEVDEQRILQVLINLLSNAIKFSPAESTVSISARLSEGSVEVRVTDKGRGIAQEFCEKIFDRFEQVEIADARLKGGTGLGLSVCKALIELHGGTIGVHSEVGKGSTFWFSIPQMQEQIALDEDCWVIPIVT